MTTEPGDESGPYITVECRSPRHARGKIAKIVTYAPDLFNDGEWSPAVPPGLKRLLRQRRSAAKRGVSPPGHRLEQMAVKCNLCGRALPDGFDNLRGDAQILNAIATRGELETSISLEELHGLASRRHKR